MTYAFCSGDCSPQSFSENMTGCLGLMKHRLTQHLQLVQAVEHNVSPNEQ